MAYCSYCGSQLPDSALTCPRCGRGTTNAQQNLTYQEPPRNKIEVQDDPPPVTPAKTPANYTGVQPYATGGLIAWSIITLLLCTIPGIVALVNASGINSARTEEEQQKKISTTKTWCLIGTILGGLSLLSVLISQVV